MSRQLSDLAPEFRPYAEALVQAARSLGPTTVTSTRRSWAQQQGLWLDYLQGKRALPALPPDRSMHVLGWAIDLVVGSYRAGGPPSPEMKLLGDWWNRSGGLWGGTADPVHFSVRQ